MLLGCFLLMSTEFLGFFLLYLISKSKITLTQLVSGGFVLGFVLISYISNFLNFFVGCSHLNLIIQIIFPFIIITIIYIKNDLLEKFNLVFYKRKFSFIIFDSYVLIFIILFFACGTYVIHCSIISTAENRIIRTGENDMFLEFALISSFLYGCNYRSFFLFGINNQVFVNNSFYSEFLPAQYCALLVRGGFGIKCSIFIVTVLMFYSVSLLVFSYTYRMYNSFFAAVFSVPLTFLISGYGIYYMQFNSIRNNEMIDYTFLTGRGYVPWGHIIIHCLLTSRTCLVSMAFSVLIYNIMCFHDNSYVYILMPLLVPLRSCTAVFTLFVIIFYESNNIYDRVSRLLPSILIILLHRLPVKYSPIFQKNYSYFPELKLIWELFGIAPIFIVISGFHYKSILPLTILTALLLSFYISFQKETRFNFFSVVSAIYPLIASFTAGGASLLVNISDDESITGILAAISSFLLFSLTLSTSAGTIKRYKQVFEPWRRQTGQDIANWVIGNTPPNSVFGNLIDQTWNPAVVLAGRRMVYGSDQYMQSIKFKLNVNSTDIIGWFNKNTTKRYFDYFINMKGNSNYAFFKNRAIGEMSIVYENSDYELYKWIN